MAKWIKNSDTISHTWVGKLLTANEYYELQSHEETRWANDSQLLSDIGAAKAVVSKDDSGSNDIIDVNDGINYLKDNLPKLVTMTAIYDADGKRARLKGTHSGTITAGQSLTMDHKMEQLQWPLGTNATSIFNGVQYYAQNAAVGDHMTFQIVDVDGIVYPANTVLEEFGNAFYVAPNTLEDIILYESTIVPNMYVRIIYTSIGGTNVDFICNLFRHVKA